MSALVQRGSAQGRPMALAVTIGLHVALVAGLLAMKVVEELKQYSTPIQLTKIEEKPREVPPAKPIEPVLGDPVTMPRLLPDLPVFPEDERIAAKVVEPSQIVVPPDGAGTHQGSVVAVADTPLRFQAVRPSDDYYPPQAIRSEVQGAAIVRACVDAGGHLSGMPAVVRSSRAALLDAAAVKWASEALRFQPATQGGVAVASCKEFRVSFTLH